MCKVVVKKSDGKILQGVLPKTLRKPNGEALLFQSGTTQENRGGQWSDRKCGTPKRVPGRLFANHK